MNSGHGSRIKVNRGEPARNGARQAESDGGSARVAEDPGVAPSPRGGLCGPAVASVLGACAVGAVLAHGLGPKVADWVANESGPVEMLGLLMFALAGLLEAWFLTRERSRLRLAGTAMLVWAVLRELDFQKRFTHRSVESLGYFSRPDAPWTEKSLVLLVLVPFAAAGLYLALTFARRVWSALERRPEWVGQSLAAMLLAVAGTVLEKTFELNAAEEVCEAGLAVTVLMLVWTTRPQGGPTGEPAEQPP